MPTWTNPTTWVDGYLMGASALNTHLRDNLNALMNPNNFEMQTNGAFSTTATTFATMTSTALVVQGGGPVLIGGRMPVFVSNNAQAQVVVDVDGNQVTIFSGTALNNQGKQAAWSDLWTGLSVASHTISIKWKTDAGIHTASTTGADWLTPVTLYAIEL